MLRSADSWRRATRFADDELDRRWIGEQRKTCGNERLAMESLKEVRSCLEGATGFRRAWSASPPGLACSVDSTWPLKAVGRS